MGRPGFLRVASFLCCVLFGLPLVALPDPSGLCDAAASQAAQESGVPIDILLAIARVETGQGGASGPPWPWTINADGKGTWYPDKTTAVAAAEAHVSDGTTTFDIGCFQLNEHWHGASFASFSDMFDPFKNAKEAATTLQQLFQESGDWATAVGTYHSRTPAIAAPYIDKVKAVLAGTSGTDPAPAPVQPPVRANTFPLLQSGESGSFGSLVPRQADFTPLIGGNS